MGQFSVLSPQCVDEFLDVQFWELVGGQNGWMENEKELNRNAPWSSKTVQSGRWTDIRHGRLE